MTENQIKMAIISEVVEMLKPYFPKLTPQGLLDAIEEHCWVEKWATLPDCVRAVFEAVEVEENNGKSMPILPKYDTLRMALLRQLNRGGTKVLRKYNSTFFPISYIAKAMSAEYLGFDIKQYMRMFEKIGRRESSLHRCPRHNNKNYKWEERGGYRG